MFSHIYSVYTQTAVRLLPFALAEGKAKSPEQASQCRKIIRIKAAERRQRRASGDVAYSHNSVHVESDRIVCTSKPHVQFLVTRGWGGHGRDVFSKCHGLEVKRFRSERVWQWTGLEVNGFGSEQDWKWTGLAVNRIGSERVWQWTGLEVSGFGSEQVLKWRVFARRSDLTPMGHRIYVHCMIGRCS